MISVHSLHQKEHLLRISYLLLFITFPFFGGWVFIGDGRCHASRAGAGERQNRSREKQQEPQRSRTGAGRSRAGAAEDEAEHAHLADGRGGKLCARGRN